ncbi:hypothetical protein P43SY_007314 [Pythium insidiosum]|uniref:HAD family hydrolase n=1 Tax=Pythium insidiosum TaxID=114742 RepID=A0AAD5LI18_PYTIN|nr:hypothetical protein P43SY_007314 [Pythium insidiosum]
MTCWRYITLDATGTLLRPREHIGRSYVAHWQRVAGVSLGSERRRAAEGQVAARFLPVFRELARRSPNFGRATASDSAFAWWRALILDVMPADELAPHSMAVRDRFARELYDFYATADAWHVFEDVAPALQAWRDAGVTLGVISNFDERLPRVLDELALLQSFDVVSTSWHHGVLKPSTQIFERTFLALARGRRPARVLHVGDDITRDYEGARAAGADARWLWRRSVGDSQAERTADARDREQRVPAAHTVTTLLDLVVSTASGER